MPTILKIKGYRFFFYSNEHIPIHIHIEKNEGTAKFTLTPVELIKSKKVTASEIHEMRKLVIKNVEFLKQKWNEYYNS